LFGAAAILAGPVARGLNLRHDKAPLALVKPLGALEEAALQPYRVLERATLDATVVEALGTEQYLHWGLEDTSVPPRDPLRMCQLFITYDTGGTNLVPHVPDECRLGAGYQPAQAHENIDLNVPRMREFVATIPVRVCTFMKTAIFNREQVSVVYTFFSNGRFVATRNAVRLSINNPRERHAFFSKVEVSFPRATREESVRGAAKLLDLLLPVLVKDHYPDFSAAEEGARRRGYPRDQ
jgi:hypothetical protein